MQLRRARFLSTASTTCQGASGMWVALEHHLLGLGVLLPAPARLEVHRAQLPLLQRIVDAHQEAQMLLLVGDREPIFDQDDARAHQHALELRRGLEELLVFLVGAEAHDALDARAVVPAAVEQHDFAAGGQVRGVALEIPLAALALARRRQRRDAADARIEPLRDALDDAALARGIAPLEQHDDLELLVHDPVLQLDQFALQPQQLLEVEFPIQRLVFGMVGDVVHHLGDALVVDFQLHLFVEIVDDFAMDALEERARFLDGLSSFIAEPPL